MIFFAIHQDGRLLRGSLKYHVGSDLGKEKARLNETDQKPKQSLDFLELVILIPLSSTVRFSPLGLGGLGGYIPGHGQISKPIHDAGMLWNAMECLSLELHME